MSTSEPLADLAAIQALYARWGANPYAEEVSQTAHAVQCARLAQAEGAPPHLVLAALLHDIGHLLALDVSHGEWELATDLRHEVSGARALTRVFDANVTGPIALHVAAKRYLCAVHTGYAEALSPTSRLTLRLQGGPMTDDEARRFEAHPHARDAVTLRRWDDTGKRPEWAAAGDDEALDTFCEILRNPAA